MWVKIHEKSKGIDYEIEIRTTNPHTHSLMSGRKSIEYWNSIVSHVRTILQESIKERENK